MSTLEYQQDHHCPPRQWWFFIKISLGLVGCGKSSSDSTPQATAIMLSDGIWEVQIGEKSVLYIGKTAPDNPYYNYITLIDNAIQDYESRTFAPTGTETIRLCSDGRRYLFEIIFTEGICFYETQESTLELEAKKRILQIWNSYNKPESSVTGKTL